MPSGRYPTCPSPYQVLVVQPQDFDRDSANRRCPNDDGAIVTPSEVLVPDLFTRIEERDHAATDWIGAIHSRSLGTVAQRTGQPEILLSGRSAGGYRDDVLQVQRHGGEQLGSQTVAAPLAGRAGDFLAHRPGNRGPMHTCYPA